MTLPDLEKLEVLHAAATPTVPPSVEYDENSGAWFFIGPLHDGPADEENGPEHKKAQADAAFINALHNAFPLLANALREAWALCAEYDRERAEWIATVDRFKADIGTLTKERDEAIRQGDERLATLWDEKKAEITRLTKERDEARDDADAKKVLLQAVARACRGAQPVSEEALSVLGNVLRERDESRVELGEALDELAYIREEYGDGDPAEMTADALMVKVKLVTLDYNKARDGNDAALATANALLAEAQAELHRQRLVIQSHDCGYGESGPGLIFCPIDKPCTKHRPARAEEELAKAKGKTDQQGE